MINYASTQSFIKIFFESLAQKLSILIKSWLVGSNLLCPNLSTNNFNLQEGLFCLLLLGMFINLSSIVLSLNTYQSYYIWIEIFKYQIWISSKFIIYFDYVLFVHFREIYPLHWILLIRNLELFVIRYLIICLLSQF